MNLLRTVQQKINRILRNRHNISQDHSNSQAQALDRSKVQIAGVFIFIGLLAVAGANMRADDTKASNSSVRSQTKPTSINLDTSTDTPTPSLSTTDSATNDTSNNVTSTSINSTNVNGQAETTITVNGQPVEVPSGSSSQQTVTNQNGTTTTVNISNQSSSSGDAHGYSREKSYIRTNSSSSAINRSSQ